MKSLIVSDIKELEILLKGMDEIYDVVRIVDPVDLKILVIENNELIVTSQCFDVWKRPTKCINCISGRCVLKKERIEKLETNGEIPYFVVAVPLVIKSSSYEHPLTLEVVTKAKELQTDYNDEDLMPLKIEELNKKVFYDSLTGIYNRRFYDEKVMLLSPMVIKDNPIVFAMCDVFKFKNVNDKYGHSFGDYVIENVASIISNNLRKDDVVIRYGGDEFIVIMQNISLDIATNRISIIQDKINEFFKKESNRDIRINVGLAHCDKIESKDDVIELFNMADHNMYIDKTNSK